jgi:hypothetical protein
MAGAGMPHSIGDRGYMIVGDMYLPPNLFENNPNIVIATPTPEDPMILGL